MKKIQIEKTIKTFEELTSEEQVINNYREINIDFDTWNDYILDEAKEKIEKDTIFKVDTKDFLWAVGDRHSKFGLYSKDIINQIIRKYEDKGVYDIATPEKFGSFLNHLGGGICRQSHTENGLATIYFEDDRDSLKTQNKAVSDEINEQIDTLIDILSEYHTKNEEAYNYSISDDSVKDTLIANEYEFDTETMRIY